MNRINGQTILEEDYDENYEPTEEGKQKESRRGYFSTKIELQS